MRRFILLLLVLIPLGATRADALTLREVIELSRSGLGDDVLIALIEVEKSVFAIDHETIKKLKAEGLSERVMIAMIKSGRTSAPPSSPVAVAPAASVAAPAPAPQIVIVEHRHTEYDEPRVREVAVPVAVPVYVTVPVHAQGLRRSRSRSVRADIPLAPYQQPNLPIHLQQPERAKKVEPVYWGWGGKLRPDAWKPDK
jgi:hypothetical protein